MIDKFRRKLNRTNPIQRIFITNPIKQTKIRAFTAGIGAKYLYYAKKLKDRFQHLNNIELTILEDKHMKEFDVPHPCWIKPYIINLASNCDYIMWIDSDIIPFRPLNINFDNIGYAALVEDSDKNYYCQTLGTINYYNTGLLIVKSNHKELFESWKKFKNKRSPRNQYDQYYFNQIVDHQNVTILNPKHNWLRGFGQYPLDVMMIHCEGSDNKIHLDAAWSTALTIATKPHL